MHWAPKEDRFVCVRGEGTLLTRNEQTGNVRAFLLAEFETLIIIPPYNSHMIMSRLGCTILNICSEPYDDSKPYNQLETSFDDLELSQWQVF